MDYSLLLCAVEVQPDAKGSAPPSSAAGPGPGRSGVPWGREQQKGAATPSSVTGPGPGCSGVLWGREQQAAGPGPGSLGSSAAGPGPGRSGVLWGREQQDHGGLGLAPGLAPREMVIAREKGSLLVGVIDVLQVGIYKIFFHFEAFVHESILLVLPPPLALLTPLQYYCTDIAQNTTLPPTPLLYAIHHTILAIAISCKGQPAGVDAPAP